MSCRKTVTYVVAQPIDQDDNNIANYEVAYPATTFFFGIDFRKENNAGDGIVFDYVITETEEELLEIRKNKLTYYRKAKAEGKAVKSAAVKAEFEKYKQAGLVEE